MSSQDPSGPADPALWLSTNAGDAALQQATDFGVHIDHALQERDPDHPDGPWVAFVQSAFEPEPTSSG